MRIALPLDRSTFPQRALKTPHVHLAIMHYHLNRGGVTQVILNHLRALAAARDPVPIDEVVLLYGGRQQDWPAAVFSNPPPFPLRLVEIEELDYDSKPDATSSQLAGTLRRVLADTGAAPDNTLLHVHNHALGKNASLPGALATLATEGYRQLLQIHDFVEDLRPQNYRHLATALAAQDNASLAAQLYPQGAGIHYAVLNQRDRLLLLEAGVDAGRLHSLPNPVAEFDGRPDFEAARADVIAKLSLGERSPLVVYPVRGIRRKNLGEMLLVSALDRRSAVYATTLAPLNPVELQSFQAWQRHAQSLQLACQFDLGGAGGVPFLYALAAADALLTTSVAEGFGMVFLEAWLVGRMLVGRNLPEITSDFVQAGISLEGLYDRLAVPLELVDEEAWRRDMQQAYRRVCAAYRQAPAAPREVDSQLDELAAASSVDFAFMSVPLQRDLIARVSRDQAVADEILARNPRLEAALRVDSVAQRDTIRQSAEAVRNGFSLGVIGRRLADLYDIVFRSRADSQLTRLPCAEAILNRFLDIRRLHPLRVDYHGEN
jgi:glycosyltransferase involved in cell wall biosynthesis